MSLGENLAFVFPGQGSQKVGMLSELYDKHEIVRGAFEVASSELGYDLWALVINGPAETLNLTENTQPALLCSSVALYRLWQQRGGAIPSYMAGHSLGEWSALVCAGVVELKDAIRLVHLRGRYMQEAVPVGVGAMAAVIGLADEVIVGVCAGLANEGVVAAVNFNTPGQVVIAGEKALVEKAGMACREAGAKKVMPLPVSAPFHTAMMKPAAERLADDMAAVDFNDPIIPIVHNVTAAIESNGAKIRELMIEQIYSPVRWVECVETLKAIGTEKVVECGPGKVLASMMRRIDKTISTSTLDTQAAFDGALESN
ncbi:MAG: [acyl-carrier-protein] S-malonyltransferase [Flavobacteriales bacterium]|jgi:[acyl-carrier-protein] S-malonyltransferase